MTQCNMSWIVVHLRLGSRLFFHVLTCNSFTAKRRQACSHDPIHCKVTEAPALYRSDRWMRITWWETEKKKKKEKLRLPLKTFILFRSVYLDWVCRTETVISRNLSSVQSHVLSVHEATVERNDSLLTGRNLWQNQTQEEWPSASTCWGLRRQKRGDNKHRNTIQRIPV